MLSSSSRYSYFILILDGIEASALLQKDSLFSVSYSRLIGAAHVFTYVTKPILISNGLTGKTFTLGISSNFNISKYDLIFPAIAIYSM